MVESAARTVPGSSGAAAYCGVSPLARCRGASVVGCGYDDAGLRFCVAHGRFRTGRRGCRDGRATQHE
ncbi:hypothetical protein DIE15_23275 [Burkholderia sp. Bp9031]|nr:hypothetical protein DIE15_23275 [Burkholderia sp. Bp9031]